MNEPQFFNPVQRPLLDGAGVPVFDFKRDTAAHWDDRADLRVERMPFQFLWKATAEGALPLALATLIELYRLPPQKFAAWSAQMQPLDVELWGTFPATGSATLRADDVKVCAYVRDLDDDDILRVYEHRGRMALSLPHPSFWAECNLAWLTDPPDCCARSRLNSMPWRGRCCGCET